jgi:hypothetical protein
MNGILLKGLSSDDNKPFWKYIEAKRHDYIGVAPVLDKDTLHSNNQAKACILN